MEKQYKFDPMDFETFIILFMKNIRMGINLILWILKLSAGKEVLAFFEYKFDPMDFETYFSNFTYTIQNV